MGFVSNPGIGKKFVNKVDGMISEACGSYIEEAKSNDGFKAKRDTVKKALEFLRNIKKSAKDNWCQ